MPLEPWRVRKTALSTLGANCSRGLEGSREARTAGEGEGGSPQLQLMEEVGQVTTTTGKCSPKASGKFRAGLGVGKLRFPPVRQESREG